MRAKKIVYFLIGLLVFSGLMSSVDALSDTTVSFRGAGVTVDLTYPKEASPIDNSNIFHNLTITAYNYVNSLNITLFIYAPINSNWQIIDPPHIISWPYPLGVNQSLPTAEINFTLPQNAYGILKCTLYVQTNQTVNYSSYTFYTTYVSEPTLSEMQSLYYEMLANYTSLQTDYETLLDEYDGLLANYSSLFANYTALLSAHNQLTADYNGKVAAYASLLAQYNKLSDDYDSLDANYQSKISDFGALQTDYEELNSTRFSLQTSYDTLQAIYNGLNRTYNELQTELATMQQSVNDSVGELDIYRVIMFIFTVAVATLIVLIIYLKRRKEEPYVVIRKETVSMKSDEES